MSNNFGGFRPPFTALQWQELEHQALIFKYLVAGLPVPLELVIPIKKSFESMSTAFFQHYPTMNYCSLYGKKPDAEPGRCRRTDGKKWRCSKDAYPDSKYCDRHMHRGRTNRSRKLVEAQNQSSSTTTTTSSVAAALHSHSVANSNPQGIRMGMLEPISTKPYKHLQGRKQDAEEHSFLSDPSRGVEMDTSIETVSRGMPSYLTSLPQSRTRTDSVVQLGYPEMPTLLDLGHSSITSTRQSQQHQYCFFGGEYGYEEPVKQEGQSLRPFFNEWPKVRDPWSDMDQDMANRTSYSTTQLSISIPMGSEDYSATSSQSPNEE